MWKSARFMCRQCASPASKALFAQKVLALCANPPSIAAPRTASPAAVLLAAHALCTALLLACTPSFPPRPPPVCESASQCRLQELRFPHPSAYVCLLLYLPTTMPVSNRTSAIHDVAIFSPEALCLQWPLSPYTTSSCRRTPAVTRDHSGSF